MYRFSYIIIIVVGSALLITGLFYFFKNPQENDADKLAMLETQITISEAKIDYLKKYNAQLDEVRDQIVTNFADLDKDYLGRENVIALINKLIDDNDRLSDYVCSDIDIPTASDAKAMLESVRICQRALSEKIVVENSLLLPLLSDRFSLSAKVGSEKLKDLLDH